MCVIHGTIHTVHKINDRPLSQWCIGRGGTSTASVLSHFRFQHSVWCAATPYVTACLDLKHIYSAEITGQLVALSFHSLVISYRRNWTTVSDPARVEITKEEQLSVGNYCDY